MKKTKNKNLTDILLYCIVDKFSDREDSVHERVISAEKFPFKIHLQRGKYLFIDFTQQEGPAIQVEKTITHRAVTYLRYGNGEVVMLDE